MCNISTVRGCKFCPSSQIMTGTYCFPEKIHRWHKFYTTSRLRLQKMNMDKMMPKKRRFDTGKMSMYTIKGVFQGGGLSYFGKKKTFFNPSLSLRLFEQLRCGQSCTGSKNHPQRHYLQVFWVMDTSSHFCLSFEERVRVFGFFLFLCVFVTFCLR